MPVDYWSNYVPLLTTVFDDPQSKQNEILNKLDSVRLINSDFTGAGARGRSRLISVRYDPDEILKRIKH